MLLLTREEERYGEGLAVGEAEGRLKTLNATMDLMKSQGMSTKQIDDFRLSILKLLGEEQ